MKKWLLIFTALLIVFSGIYLIKPKVPAYRPDPWSSSAPDETDDWWAEGKPTVNPKFVLDPEIPINYIPVLGEEETYMVVDEQGNVTKYRQREKQADGSWVWHDIDPNIPKDFVKVEGLDDVYKQKQPDGTYKYYKYVRNPDNTYYFQEVNPDGSPLPTPEPDANIIPPNYKRVTGNIYAVLDENGVIIGYKERIRLEDGTYKWVDAAEPTPTPKPTPVPDNGSSGGNNNGGNTGGNNGGNNQGNPGGNNSGGNTGGNNGGVVIIPGKPAQQQTEDGGYIRTEVTTETKQAGGYLITYEVTVISKYDKNGELMSTKKETKELSRTPVGGNNMPIADRSKILGTLDAELGRITSGITFEGDMPSQLLAAWNAERALKNLAPLTLDDGDAMKLAKLKAADMAIYNYADYESYMYGTLADIVRRYGIDAAETPSELCLKTTPKSAADLCSRFILQSRDVMLSSAYTKVGIAVTRANGYMYADIVLLK